jgi:hypothetical protein
LGERAREYLGGNTIEFGVELDGSDETTGARNLEVHVPERIFSA